MKNQLYSVVYKGVLVEEDRTPPLNNQVWCIPFVDTLEYLQQLVGGTIEHFVIDEELDKKHIDMWINEEGKMLNLHPSIALEYDGQLVDIIVGDCVFTKYDNEGNTLGLTLEETNIVSNWIKRQPMAMLRDKSGNSFPVIVVSKGGFPQTKVGGSPTDTGINLH